MVRVKGLVCPHDCYQVLGIGQVNDVVRVAGEHVYGLDFVAAHFEFDHFVGADLAFLNQGASAHHDKEFPLGVVPVFALGDSRLGHVHAELAAVHRLQEFGKAAASIHVHLEREAHLFLGQVAQVSRIELFREAVVRDFGHHQRLRLVVELVQQIHDGAELDFVDRRDVAIQMHWILRLRATRFAQDDTPGGVPLNRNNLNSIKGTVVFSALQRGYHLGDKVVDVEQFHVHVRVVHLDGEVVRDVVAECGHGAVVVGAAPLSEQVRESVHQNARAGLATVFKEQFFARLFTAAVLAVAETARQRRLDAAAEHHRTQILVAFERFQKVARKAEIARHELAVVLGAVYASQVEHEVRMHASIIQLGQNRVDIVFINFTYNEVAAGAVLAVADVLERRNQVAPHKTFCTSNENIHKITILKRLIKKFFFNLIQEPAFTCSKNYLVHRAQINMSDQVH